MRPPVPAPDRIPQTAQQPSPRQLSRRRLLLWTAGLLCAPLVAQQAARVRRRLRGEPGPTGWFGHC
jgi:hypothetical protein